MYPYGKQSISWRDVFEVVKTLRSPFLTQGPTIREFEVALEKYTGAKYCVAFSNGTAALHGAMYALGIKEGDEVITSPITFVASANCVLYQGGSPQFVDIDPATACIDADKIEAAITKKTKALIPVHFAGQSCDMQRIYSIAKKYNLFVIEDAAHAIGSEYKGHKVGSCTYSDMTMFSFHPVKTIATAEGGVMLTNNEEHYKKLLLFRTHGITRDPALFTKNEGPWYHEMHELGYNYRLSDIHAALGLSQLKRLDLFAKKRRHLVELYKQMLGGDARFSFLEEKDYSKAAWHLCPLLINFSLVKKTKRQIFEDLKKRGLLAQVHYIPVHLQPFYAQRGFKGGDFPYAEQYYAQTISLPLYYDLNASDIKKIVTLIKDEVY
jgi:perosamine synthetase